MQKKVAGYPVAIVECAPGGRTKGVGSSAQRMQKVHLVVNLSLWRLFGKGGGRVTRFTICVGKYVLLDQFREGGPYLKTPTVEIAQRAIPLGCPTHV